MRDLISSLVNYLGTESNDTHMFDIFAGKVGNGTHDYLLFVFLHADAWFSLFVLMLNRLTQLVSLLDVIVIVAVKLLGKL